TTVTSEAWVCHSLRRFGPCTVYGFLKNPYTYVHLWPCPYVRHRTRTVRSTSCLRRPSPVRQLCDPAFAKKLRSCVSKVCASVGPYASGAALPVPPGQEQRAALSRDAEHDLGSIRQGSLIRRRLGFDNDARGFAVANVHHLELAIELGAVF